MPTRRRGQLAERGRDYGGLPRLGGSRLPARGMRDRERKGARTMAALDTLTAAQQAAPTIEEGAGALSDEMLARFRRGVAGKPAYHLAQNALARVSIDDVALNHEIVAGTDHTFSHLLDDWAVTNQKQTGRCWMFAGLNLFRVGAMRKMGLKEFEFSQNYTLFWDKIERANYFLEAIIETADRDLDDRTVAFLLERPVE